MKKTLRSFIILTLPIFSFTLLFWKDWKAVGPTEDEAYIYKRENKVLDIKIKGEGTKYEPVFSGCQKEVVGGIKIVSRNFPPIYSIKAGDTVIPVLVWPHITYLTYFPQVVAIAVGRKLTELAEKQSSAETKKPQRGEKLFLAEKILNYLLVCITIAVIFFVAKEIFGETAGFLSSLIYSTFSSTVFFTQIGISIDFIFHTLYFWLAVLFLLKMRKKGRVGKPLIFSSLMGALSMLSYLKFSSWGVLVLASFFLAPGTPKDKLKSSLIFFLITFFFFFIFYVLPSVSLLGWECPETYSINVLSSTANLISGFLKFQTKMVSENLSLLYEDIMRMIDLTGYGTRLAYQDSLSYNVLPSAVLFLSAVYLFVFGNKEARFLVLAVILYNIALYVEIPVEGFHRKLRPLMPALVIIQGKFLNDIIMTPPNVKRFQKHVLSLAVFLTFFLIHIHFQTEKVARFKDELSEKGRWSIQTSYKAQRKLLEFLLYAKEKGIYVANFSATPNLDLIADEEMFFDYDYSYIVHFSRSYLMLDRVFWNIAFSSICELSRTREIYIVSDFLTERFLSERAEKIAVIGKVFHIFSCKSPRKEQNPAP